MYGKQTTKYWSVLISQISDSSQGENEPRERHSVIVVQFFVMMYNLRVDVFRENRGKGGVVLGQKGNIWRVVELLPKNRRYFPLRQSKECPKIGGRHSTEETQERVDFLLLMISDLLVT